MLTAMSAVIMKADPWAYDPQHPPPFLANWLLLCDSLFMDQFENMELSGYGVLSLPNFPCFCVSCEFGPSLQHPSAGWFTINRFTQLLRIKAVWLVLSSQQSPNSHSPTPQIIPTLRILESLKRPPFLLPLYFLT